MLVGRYGSKHVAFPLPRKIWVVGQASEQPDARLAANANFFAAMFLCATYLPVRCNLPALRAVTMASVQAWRTVAPAKQQRKHAPKEEEREKEEQEQLPHAEKTMAQPWTQSQNWPC